MWLYYAKGEVMNIAKTKNIPVLMMQKFFVN